MSTNSNINPVNNGIFYIKFGECKVDDSFAFGSVS